MADRDGETIEILGTGVFERMKNRNHARLAVAAAGTANAVAFNAEGALRDRAVREDRVEVGVEQEIKTLGAGLVGGKEAFPGLRSEVDEFGMKAHLVVMPLNDFGDPRDALGRGGAAVHVDDFLEILQIFLKQTHSFLLVHCFLRIESPQPQGFPPKLESFSSISRSGALDQSSNENQSSPISRSRLLTSSAERTPSLRQPFER